MNGSSTECARLPPVLLMYGSQPMLLRDLHLLNKMAAGSISNFQNEDDCIDGTYGVDHGGRKLKLKGRAGIVD